MTQDASKQPPLAGTQSHQYLRPSTSDPTLALRETLAHRWSVEPDTLAVVGDLQTLLGRTLQAVLAPGARVAVALPTADAHTRQVLACGAAYVDIGADQHFRPRQDRLDRLLDDQAVSAVVYASPNPVTGVHWSPSRTATSAVWLVEDRTAQCPAAPHDGPAPTSVAHIQLVRAGDAVLAYATPPVAEHIRLLAGFSAPPDAQASAATAPSPPDWQSAVSLGFHVSASDSPWALVTWPDKDASEVADRCTQAGVLATTGDGSWRRAVRMLWPGSDSLSKLAKLLAATLLLLGCGQEPSPKSPVSAGPAIATPAPAASRPAPNPTKSQKPPPPLPKENLHRVPVVGGCGELCPQAHDAVKGFAAALIASDRVSRLPLFLDTSRLVVDGQAVGRQLGQMWMKGQVSPRLQAIAALVERLAKASKQVVPAAFQEAAETLELEAVRPRSAVAKLPLPGVGDTWTLTLGRRGLEWLVVAIDTSGE